MPLSLPVSICVCVTSAAPSPHLSRCLQDTTTEIVILNYTDKPSYLVPSLQSYPTPAATHLTFLLIDSDGTAPPRGTSFLCIRAPPPFLPRFITWIFILPHIPVNVVRWEHLLWNFWEGRSSISHKDVTRAGAPLPRRQAGRPGVGQPGEDSGETREPLPVPKRGCIKRRESDFLHGWIVTGQGAMIFNW